MASGSLSSYTLGMSDGYRASGTPRDTSFMLVPVPTERVLEVYALLAGEEVHNREQAEGWSEADLRRLVEVVRSELTMSALDHLSARPGLWVPQEDLANACGASSVALRAAFSGLTRTLKARLRREDWPVAVRSQRLEGKLRTTYTMDEQTAEAFRKVRKSERRPRASASTRGHTRSSAERKR
jgi:hypothetical protein